MANGLDAGDSLRRSDKFKFFRGNKTDASAGHRDVPLEDLITLFNDPTVLDNVGGGGGGATNLGTTQDATTVTVTSDTGTDATLPQAIASGNAGVMSGADKAKLDGLPTSAPSQADIDRLEQNIGLNSLRDAVNGGWAWFNMVDGVADVFTDETGVNTGGASNANYNAAGDYYAPASAASANLLIQSETTNGSTTFTDSTGTHTITANGTAQHSTAQAQFGSSSISIGGSGNELSIPASTDWAFGTGDFTIDYWIRYTSTVGRYHMGTGAGANQWAIDQNSTTTIRMVFNAVSQTFTVPTMSAGTWYHIAVVRSGNNLRLFVDGTESTTGSLDVTGVDITDSTTGLEIGDGNVALGFTGYMEEIRIVKGTAEFTADFTAPTAPYSLTAQNMTLPSIEFTTQQASPASARSVVLYDPIDTVTLNTDLILEFSRDSGTTWTTATLEADAVFSGDVLILVTDDIDISAQPAGTGSIIWRITTANTVDVQIHGVYLQWR